MSQRRLSLPTGFSVRRKCVETSGDVIKGSYVICGIVSSPFFWVYDAIGHVTETEAKKLADFTKRSRGAVIAWLKEKYSKLANT